MSVVQAGSLELYGFEEIEPMVVEDTLENRTRIRRLEGHWLWEQVKDDDGGPTGLIRALSPETLLERRTSVWDQRRSVLVDPENPWSDYVGPDEWPLEADVPSFVANRVQRWKQQAREGVPEEDRRPFPVRCETIRHDETRCWNWATKPTKSRRCSPHAGWVNDADLRNAQVARIKLLQSSPMAADNLEFLALHAEGEAVRLKATTEILDRSGVRAGMDLTVEATVTVDDPATEVKSRLDKLATRVIKQRELEHAIEARAQEENTVDAEVISDTALTITPSD